MIVVDTSALIAIYLGEPECERFTETIGTTSHALVTTPTEFEFKMVVERMVGEAGIERAERILATRPIQIVAWEPTLVPVALEARRRFSGRPARLNFGDCMAYALAKSLGAPLLFKGDDFIHTDIASAA